MNKYVRVMDGLKSNAGGFEYKLNEINVSDSWNPEAHSGKEFGGFNFTTESCILRWLHRGSTIYDVEIPKDAETVKIEGATILFRTNKIIVKNPRKVNDDLALHYYEISNIPEKSYYKALGAVAVMNYKKTALKILKDKVNKNNINEVLEEWNEFIDHDGKNDRKDSNETVKLIERILLEIKADN
ncbi:MAG: hypothetical protein MSH48_00240 [Mollicutes bacterium]|nr:hypothetical protein [Mollicutes bacterium]